MIYSISSAQRLRLQLYIPSLIPHPHLSVSTFEVQISKNHVSTGSLYM